MTFYQKAEESPFCVLVILANDAYKFKYESTLNSVLWQHYAKKKVVVVVDGAEDGTRRLVIQRVRTERGVVVVTNKDREGVVRSAYAVGK